MGDPADAVRSPFATIEVSRATLRHAQRHEVPYELVAWEIAVLAEGETDDLLQDDSNPQKEIAR